MIQYLGRKQRHKPVDQVLGELDALYRIGHRFVFLADDNFTAHRGRAKELLAALRDWNSRRDRGEIGFTTQVSIDAAKDEELLEGTIEIYGRYIFVAQPYLEVAWRHGGQCYNSKIGHQCHGPKPVGGVNFRAKVGGKIAGRVY
ncbi:MAG: hypothetical protein M3436_11690 [Pseudomonadota bacterium]|nr:hypothetical protein [Pseudomonadota bacterium]